MDDFPGLFFEEGFRFADSKTVHSFPIQIQADFQNDSDWIGIGANRPYLDYHVIVYLPEDGLTPIEGSYQWAVFDEDLNQLDSGEQLFRVPFSVRQFDTARYLRITADAATENDPGTGDPIDVPAFYRVGIGQQGDAVGNTIGSATPYQNTWQGRLGGSILDEADVDYYSVELASGVEYEFTLVGDLDGSLPNPVFELHDDSGLLVESAGDSEQQRIIQFTPDEAATYYLKVAQDGPLSFFDFGGYFISSPQFDDDFLSDSAITRGVVTPGVTFTNSVDFPGDIDWARLDLEPFYTYQVQTPLTDEVSLVDSTGRLPNGAYFDSVDNVIVAREEPNDLFVQFSGDVAGEFLFDAVDEHEDTDLDLASGARGRMFGALDAPGDVDLFEAFMVPFADYELSVDTSILDSISGDLVVEAVNVDGSVAATFNFNETQSSFTFSADDGNASRVTAQDLTRSQNFRVRSSSDAITGYRIALTPIGVDSVPDTLGTSDQLSLPGGVGRVQGLLEGEEDWDVFRVELKANTRYELDFLEWPTGEVGLYRATDSGAEPVFGETLNRKQYFRFAEAGTYYIAAGRSNSEVDNNFAAYQFKFTENAVPPASLGLLYPERGGRSLNYGKRILPTEVWSELPLRVRNDEGGFTTFAARTTHQLSAFQWENLQIAPNATGPGEIIYRNIASDGRRYAWEKRTVVNDDLLPAFRSALVSRPGYWFAETAPQYIANSRFNATFEPLDESQRELVSTALQRWGTAVRPSFEDQQPEVNNQMQIFLAALGSDEEVVSFAPGNGIGSDLILNSQSSLFNAGEFQPEALYEVLRGIGTSIGLPPVASVDRFVSVMGTREVEAGNADVWPTWPMPADLKLSSGFFVDSAQEVRFSNDGGFAEAVVGTAGTTTISAEDVTRSVVIDLRHGQSSSVLGSPQLQTFHLGPLFQGTRAIGGSNDDALIGNDAINVLDGNAGDDVLIGGAGNDRLFGGPGDDYYIFRAASGLDFVDETKPGDGGVDVVRFEGMYDYDSIEEDFTFRRFGNDLLIRLELNGRRNNNGDQIRIRNMHEEASRIEAMALLNTDGFVNRISLQSVWEQATEVRRRFEVVAGNDGFGTLVSPV